MNSSTLQRSKQIVIKHQLPNTGGLPQRQARDSSDVVAAQIEDVDSHPRQRVIINFHDRIVRKVQTFYFYQLRKCFL